MSADSDKRAAALAAARQVEDGMCVGLGTGSTAAHAIAALGGRVHDGLRMTATATSRATEALARSHGIAVLDFDGIAHVDLTIDGVDQIDPGLRAIKGGGGAMLREKIVADASTRMIAIADGSKAVARLDRAVPVEILPFAAAFVLRRLAEHGGPATLRPTRSDQGNLLADAAFGTVANADALAAALSAIPGLLGHGLFLREIDALCTARDGVVSWARRA